MQVSSIKNFNLLQSVEKHNFSKAKQEWIYYGMVDNKFCGANCHLCCHERIRYEFTIINRLNKQAMVVGSECIKKFTEGFTETFYDTKGNVVTEKRLTEDKNDYLKRFLNRELDEKIVPKNNNFYNSIVKQIKEDGKLSPLQISYLKSFYNTLNETGQQAFKMVVKVNLKTNKQKQQMKEFKWHELQFVGQFMSSQQRERYNIILK